MARTTISPVFTAPSAEERRTILKLLRDQKRAIDIDVFPNLFVLGPQCTGTTWAHKNLDQHPHIHMSRKKEPLLFVEERLVRFVGQEKDLDLSHYLRYFKQNPIQRLFFPRPLVRGEASASYAWQPKEIIEGVVSLQPDLRGIIMIRDPVDKVWSNLRRKMVSERGYDSPENVPEAEIERFINNPHQIRTAMFTQMIENWSHFLKEGHLYVGLFTDIANRPRELLLDLFEFLGVDKNPKYVTKHAYRKIRVAKKRPIPQRWESELEETFREERERLRTEFGLEVR